MRSLASIGSRVLREPLIWFVAAGGLLFVAYAWLNPKAFERVDRDRIVLTQDDLRQMSVQWRAQGLPPLNAEQWKSLIDSKVREEVLYREAIALGLDRDDTIVKRRMVQKMDFLAQDVAMAREPTSAELRDWFVANPDRFKLPPRVSFRHAYFSFDRRGARAKDHATTAAKALGSGALSSISADPFMFQDEYAERTPDQIARDFGPAFAKEIFDLAQGSRRGAVESGYGWHVVEVSGYVPPRLPAFEEIEPEVKIDWIGEQTSLAKRRVYEVMRARYKVELPDLPVDERPSR